MFLSPFAVCTAAFMQYPLQTVNGGFACAAVPLFGRDISFILVQTAENPNSLAEFREAK
jgi:hypothetical protein